MNVSELIFEVENKPKFDARVRHCKVDFVPLCNLERFCEVGVLINVDYAPVAVVAGSSSSSFVLEPLFAFSDGVSHDRERCSMASVDDHGGAWHEISSPEGAAPITLRNGLEVPAASRRETKARATAHDASERLAMSRRFLDRCGSLSKATSDGQS